MVRQFIHAPLRKGIRTNSYLLKTDHCGFQCSPGNKPPSIAFLLALTDSFASPGHKPPLLLALPVLHSFALACPFNFHKEQIVWNHRFICWNQNHAGSFRLSMLAREWIILTCLSATIYKFLNLTCTSAFYATCWVLIPLLWSSHSFGPSIYLLKLTSLFGFKNRPGTNHPACFSAGIYGSLRLTFPWTFFAVCSRPISLLWSTHSTSTKKRYLDHRFICWDQIALLLRILAQERIRHFTDSLSLPSYEPSCCLLAPDYFALVCLSNFYKETFSRPSI